MQHCLVQQNAWGGTCASWGANDLDPEVFEEYRYDALGRRIWRRARYFRDNPHGFSAYVQRTLWDGDQILR